MSILSTDLIGWETLKNINFQRRFDQSLAEQESMDSHAQAIKAHLETMKDGPSKGIILQSLDTMVAFIKLQRVQMIWINALREGMMGIESRLDKLDQDKS